jgi:hypothetical protein
MGNARHHTGAGAQFHRAGELQVLAADFLGRQDFRRGVVRDGDGALHDVADDDGTEATVERPHIAVSQSHAEPRIRGAGLSEHDVHGVSQEFRILRNDPRVAACNDVPSAFHARQGPIDERDVPARIKSGDQIRGLRHHRSETRLAGLKPLFRLAPARHVQQQSDQQPRVAAWLAAHHRGAAEHESSAAGRARKLMFSVEVGAVPRRARSVQGADERRRRGVAIRSSGFITTK